MHLTPHFRAPCRTMAAGATASFGSVCRDLEAQGLLWPLVFNSCRAVSFLTGLDNSCSVIVVDGVCVSP